MRPAVLAGVLVFSQAMLKIVDVMQRQVLRHNRELEGTAVATVLGHSLQLKEILQEAFEQRYWNGY